MLCVVKARCVNAEHGITISDTFGVSVMCLGSLDLWIPPQVQTLLLLQIFKESLCFGRDISPNMLSLLFRILYKLAGSHCTFSLFLQDTGMIGPTSPQLLSGKFWGPHYKLLLFFSSIRYIVWFSVWQRPLDSAPY